VEERDGERRFMESRESKREFMRWRAGDQFL
jgi:hypothetical protein